MNELIEAAVKLLTSPAPTGLGLSGDMVSEQPEGRPPPRAGQLYYAVHQGEWSNVSDLSLDQKMGLKITITQRTSVLPKDKLKKAMADLRQKASVVATKFHMSYVHMNTANDLIADGYGFSEPLRFQNCDTVRIVTADWFSSEADDEAGVAITVNLGGALRIQPL